VCFACEQAAILAAMVLMTIVSFNKVKELIHKKATFDIFDGNL
jgi:hypothetical protein